MTNIATPDFGKYRRIRPSVGLPAWGRDDTMAVSAVRYCLGRRTYITSDCADWLIQYWPLLLDSARNVIQRDVEEAFTKDDEDRALERKYRALGDACDRAQWERVRALWAESPTP